MRFELALLVVAGCAPGRSGILVTVESTGMIANVASLSVSAENAGQTSSAIYPVSPAITIPSSPATTLLMVFGADRSGAVSVTIDAYDGSGTKLARGEGSGNLVPSHETDITVTLQGGVLRDGGAPTDMSRDMTCGDVTNDPSNCGKCGNVCMTANGTAKCAASKCGVMSCTSGYAHCAMTGTDCEANVNTDVANCSGCNMPCTTNNGTAKCSAGTCAIATCQMGWEHCAMVGTDCETHTDVDILHCGSCPKACSTNHATPMCVMGACKVGACSAGYGDCNTDPSDGCEVNTTTDTMNCSACGMKCAFGANCINSLCVKDKVLVIGTSAVPLGDVAAKLTATAAFSTVSTIDASIATPGLPILQMYAAVLVYSDAPFLDKNALGDNLADYYDGGGRVVIASGSNTNAFPVGGKFLANGYLLINQGALQTDLNDQLGMIDEPMSFLMTNVVTMKVAMGGAVSRSGGGLINGGIDVARWTNGNEPLIVRGVVKARNRADLNFYPPSTDGMNPTWTGDGAIILRNALLYR